LGGRSLLRKGLLCPPKRRKQPERYVKLRLTFSENVVQIYRQKGENN